MTPNGAGAVQDLIESPDWYKCLEAHQLEAYIRYQFIRCNSAEYDWDEPPHQRRNAYWDGGTDKFGVKRKAAWKKVAELIRDLKADPGVFVCAHFSGTSYEQQIARTQIMPSVRPSSLVASSSPGIYARYCANFPNIAATACEVAGSTIANRLRGTMNLKLKPDDQVFYVLCDEGYVSASDFFRHAFAARMGSARGVERYLWRAAIDYEAQQRLYDLALVKEPWCFTAPLTGAIAEIRRHWMEYVG